MNLLSIILLIIYFISIFILFTLRVYKTAKILKCNVFDITINNFIKVYEDNLQNTFMTPWYIIVFPIANTLLIIGIYIDFLNIITKKIKTKFIQKFGNNSISSLWRKK